MAKSKHHSVNEAMQRQKPDNSAKRNPNNQQSKHDLNARTRNKNNLQAASNGST